MPFEHYAGFVITTVILLVVPGPNVAFIVSNSLVDGGRRGFGALIGTKIALAIQLAVVVLALGKLIAAIGPLAGVLRWGGVTGLAMLGLLAFRRRTRPRAGAVRPRHGSIVWQSFALVC
jgi:threonine/homoserine/homoserine lactone efflux protein